MDHPVHQVAGVIAALTQGTRYDQERALDDYFLPEAYFVHPFCRVPSFGDTTVPGTSYVVNSRYFLWFIYQWYRILSPKIDLVIDSSVYDQRTRRLYLTIRQTFTLWFVPFHLWQANVQLVTVLRLEPRLVDPSTGKPLPATATTSAPASNASGTNDENGDPVFGDHQTKLFIAGQEDLYQVNEFLKFIAAPFGAALVWYGWQLLATVMCILGTLVFWPVNLARDRWVSEGAGSLGKKKD